MDGDRRFLRGYLQAPADSILTWPALLLFAFALTWPLVAGQGLYWGDIDLYFLPMLRFAQQRLSSGYIPLWNPLILSGQPFLGNPQMSMLYPSTFLLAFCSAWRTLAIGSVAHLFLTGALTYLFLLRWCVQRSPALAGAFVYTGSAALMGRLQFPPMVQTAPYLPGILLCVDLCIDRASAIFVPALACMVALCLLAGHPQFAFLSLGCASAYAVARLAARPAVLAGVPNHPAAVARQAVRLSTGLVLGMAAAAVQLLPAMQLVAESSRDRMTPAMANRFYVQVQHLLTIIWPFGLGHPSLGNYWGGGNAWEPALFIGWAPLPVMVFAVLKCGRDRTVRFWGSTLLVTLWLSMGVPAGLYWLAFYVVPGVSRFHDPARFAILAVFSSCALTAVGWDTFLLRKRPPRGVRLAFPLLVAVPLAAYGPPWNPVVSRDTHRKNFETSVNLAAHALLPRGGRIYEPVHEHFWQRYITAGYADYGISPAWFEGAAGSALMPNSNMFAGVLSASGYEPVPLSAPAELDGLSRLALRRGQPDFPRLAGLTAARLVVTPRGIVPHDPGLDEARSVGPITSKLLLNSPRAWCVREVRAVHGRMRVNAAMCSPAFDPFRIAVVSSSAGLPEASVNSTQSTLPLQPLPHMVVDLAERRKWLVDCGESPALLVDSDSAYPGWRAVVDGVPGRAVRTDGALLGVPLERGRHQVELVYAPQVFRAGLYFTLAATLILAALFCSNMRGLRPLGIRGRRPRP